MHIVISATHAYMHIPADLAVIQLRWRVTADDGSFHINTFDDRHLYNVRSRLKALNRREKENKAYIPFHNPSIKSTVNSDAEDGECSIQFTLRRLSILVVSYGNLIPVMNIGLFDVSLLFC